MNPGPRSSHKYYSQEPSVISLAKYFMWHWRAQYNQVQRFYTESKTAAKYSLQHYCGMCIVL